VDVCDEATDVCDHLADDLACADGLFCNGVETCNVMLGCQAGVAVVCSDGASCTTDACNEITDSCDNIPNDALCNDGNVCTLDSCSAGGCSNQPITPCCGDGLCSTAENRCGCQQDCGAPPLVEGNCGDGVDDDCDGLIDCDDPDCGSSALCAVCRPDGETCSSDAQCCRGRCRQKNGAMICD